MAVCLTLIMVCPTLCRSLDLAGNSLDTSCGFCLGTLAGHDHFIYALAVSLAK